MEAIMEAILKFLSTIEYQNIGGNFILILGGIYFMYKKTEKSFFDSFGVESAKTLFLQKQTEIVESVKQENAIYLKKLEASLQKDNQKFRSYISEVSNRCLKLHDTLFNTYKKAEALTCKPINPQFLTDDSYIKLKTEYEDSYNNLEQILEARIILREPLEKQIDNFIQSIYNNCFEYILQVEYINYKEKNFLFNKKRHSKNTTIDIKEITESTENSKLENIQNEMQKLKNDLVNITHALRSILYQDED